LERFKAGFFCAHRIFLPGAAEVAYKAAGAFGRSKFLAALLAAVRFPSGLADEADPPAAESSAAPSAASDPIAADYERLGRDFQQLIAAYDEVFPPPVDINQPADMTVPDEPWLEQRLAREAGAPDPNSLLPRFVAFARKHPTSPLAFDALFFVVLKTGFKEFRGDGQTSPVLEQAHELAWSNHRQDPRMVHLLSLLRVPTFQSESFLKRAFEEASNRTVQAAAAYHLAAYYRALAGCHQRSDLANHKTKLTNDERFWKLVVAARLKKHLPLNAEENSRRIEDLLGQVTAEYSDVAAMGWRRTGPAGVYVHSTLYEPPKTYGRLAASVLHEITNLAPGQPAPEIVGTDADGNTFRLSDYRGPVVLLSFSANWCSSCSTFYPMGRRLQEKYPDRQFVILGVNRDETIDTLKSAIAEGKISWRCWWDGGTHGPIATNLNAAAGTLFLLDDQHIIQDARLVVFSFEEEFDQAIEPLLEKAAARHGVPLEQASDR